MTLIKFAYVGEFTSRRRRVGVGEFARRRVDRIPLQEQIYSQWCRCDEAMNVIVLEELKYIYSNCSITVTMAVDFARE